MSLDKRIERGIVFLRAAQSAAGSFPSVSSADGDAFTDAAAHHTTFYTAGTMLSLARVNAARGDRLLERGIHFLRGQQHHSGSYNYWARHSSAASEFPYPDDLDDTSLAWAALLTHGEAADAPSLARLVHLLTLAETAEGGPYRTWLVPPGADAAWLDVDIAVNSNIAFFLSLLDVQLPPLHAFLEDAVNQSRYHSPYYAGPYPVLYFLARAYKGPLQQQLIEDIVSRQTGPAVWENPFYTALMVSALSALGVPPARLAPSLAYLLHEPWQTIARPYPLVIERTTPRGSIYSGSPAMSVAVHLEAVAVGQKREKPISSSRAAPPPPALQLYQAIVKDVKLRCARLEPEMQREAAKRLDHVLGTDRDKYIGLLAYHTGMAQSLPHPLPMNVYRLLGAANFYGWMAYTVYDDILDGDGAVSLLPLANTWLRELTGIYHAVMPKTGARLFSSVMDDIESASYWEAVHCRAPVRNGQIILPEFPDYRNKKRLADRSLGYALGSVTVLLLAGHAAQSPEVSGLLVFFRHYIIARQLSDDVHDWEDDLLNGRISFVVASVLTAWQRTSIPPPSNVELMRDRLALQKIFWTRVIEDIRRDIEEHIASAKDALTGLHVFSAPNTFLALLTPLEAGMTTMAQEQQSIVAFVREYQTALYSPGSFAAEDISPA